MKTLISNLLAFLFMMTGIGTSYGQGKDELKGIIDGINKEMTELYKSANYEKLEKYYDNDAVLFPNNRPVEKGFKDILASHEFRRKGGFEVKEREVAITDLVLEDDLAIETGTYMIKVTFPGPPEPIVENGKYLTVWKKQKDDSWKIFYNMWNTDRGQAPQQKGGVQLSPGSQAPATIERGSTAPPQNE